MYLLTWTYISELRSQLTGKDTEISNLNMLIDEKLESDFHRESNAEHHWQDRVSLLHIDLQTLKTDW